MKHRTYGGKVRYLGDQVGEPSGSCTTYLLDELQR